MANIIVSVPHSGTRSLARHLKKDHHTHFKPRGTTLYKDHHVIVPLRWPLDVAVSWSRRGRSLNTLLATYETMFRFMECADNWEVFRVEDLDERIGHKLGWGGGQSATDFVSAVRDQVLLPRTVFFSEFYSW